MPQTREHILLARQVGVGLRAARSRAGLGRATGSFISGRGKETHAAACTGRNHNLSKHVARGTGDCVVVSQHTRLGAMLLDLSLYQFLDVL